MQTKYNHSKIKDKHEEVCFYPKNEKEYINFDKQ